MSEATNDRIRSSAIAITRQLVENTVRLQFVRNSLEGELDPSGVEFDEEAIVADAINLALGEDIGCLANEEVAPETVDVLRVEQLLKQIEKDMRDQCHHDFVRQVRKSVEDHDSEEAREALRSLAFGLAAYGSAGLGEWRNCKCDQEDCPYKRPLPGDPSRDKEIYFGVNHHRPHA